MERVAGQHRRRAGSRIDRAYWPHLEHPGGAMIKNLPDMAALRRQFASRFRPIGPVGSTVNRIIEAIVAEIAWLQAFL
jgi:hypothetical protein